MIYFKKFKDIVNKINILKTKRIYTKRIITITEQTQIRSISILINLPTAEKK